MLDLILRSMFHVRVFSLHYALSLSPIVHEGGGVVTSVVKCFVLKYIIKKTERCNDDTVSVITVLYYTYSLDDNSLFAYNLYSSYSMHCTVYIYCILYSTCLADQFFFLYVRFLYVRFL